MKRLQVNTNVNKQKIFKQHSMGLTKRRPATGPGQLFSSIFSTVCFDTHRKEYIAYAEYTRKYTNTF